jgi:WD40 repeat protein
LTNQASNLVDSNPYPGPSAYRLDDGLEFVGREQEGRDLVSHTIASGVVLFHALSGVGKTSLVNKRVIPLFRDKGYQLLSVARVVSESSVNAEDVRNIFIFNSLLYLSQQLSAPNSLIGKLKSFAGGLLGPSIAPLKTMSFTKFLQGVRLQGCDQPLLLIFDQFEEFLTAYPQHYNQRDPFFVELGEALRDDPRVSVIFVAREEYAARLTRFRAFLPQERLATFTIDRLTHDEALASAKVPAKKAGRPFQEVPEQKIDVASDLIRSLSRIRISEIDTREGEYIEPLLLQIACYQIWEAAKKQKPPLSEITPELVHGGSEQLLAEFYGRAVGEVAESTGTPVLTLRKWFGEKLITVDRFRSQVEEGRKFTGGLPNTVVGELYKRRLIRPERTRGTTWYELIHDSLVEPIIRSNEKSIPKTAQKLARDAGEWERLRSHNEGEQNSVLYGGKKLARAKEWAAQNPNEVGELERRFLQESSASQDMYVNRLRSATYWLTGCAIALAVVIFLLIYTYYQSGQRRIAQSLGIQSVGTIDARPERTLRLALESALEEAGMSSDELSPEARNNINTALQRLPNLLQLKLNDQVPGVAFSSDGSQCLTWDLGGHIKVWSAVTGENLTPTKEGSWKLDKRTQVGLLGTPFSTFGDLVAESGDSGDVNVLDYRTGGRLLIKPNQGTIHSLQFSPNGKYLATGGSDGSIKIWNGLSSDLPSSSDQAGPEMEKPLKTLQILESPLISTYALSFDRSESKLVAAGSDGIARVWDVPSGDLVARTPAVHSDDGTQGNIYAVSFSTDGKYLAVGGSTGLQIWDVSLVVNMAIGSKPQQLETKLVAGHRKDGIYIRTWIKALQFHPTKAIVATAGEDGQLLMWDPSNADKPIERLPGSEKAILSIQFSPDGNRLIVGNADQTANILSTERFEFLDEAELSNDGTRMAFLDRQHVMHSTGERGLDGSLTRLNVWSIADRQILPGGRVCPLCKRLVSSADGSRIAIIKAGNGECDMPGTSEQLHNCNVEIVNETGFHVHSLPVTFPSAIALDDDASVIATLTPEGFQIWNGPFAEKPDSIRKDLLIRTIALNFDGSFVATADTSAMIKLYPIRTTNRKLEIAKVEVNGTYDGVSTSEKRIISLLKFCHDKRLDRIAAAYEDGFVRVWRLDKNPALLEWSHQFSNVNDLEFSASDTYLGIATEDGAQLWDLKHNKQLLKGTSAGVSVKRIGFSADSRNMLALERTGKLDTFILSDSQLLAEAVLHLNGTLTDEECAFAEQITLRSGWCRGRRAGLEGVIEAVRLSRAAKQPKDLEAQSRALTSAFGDDNNLSQLLIDPRELRIRALLDEADFHAAIRDPDGVTIAYKAANEFQAQSYVPGAPKGFAGRHKELPSQRRDWDTVSKRLATRLVKLGQTWAKLADYQHTSSVNQAISAYKNAESIYPKLFDPLSPRSPWELTNLCWFITVDGFAERAAEFCQRAVNVAQQRAASGDYHDVPVEAMKDSRGLNSACIGKVDQAIEDFEVVVHWEGIDTRDRDLRSAWLKKLRAGENICDRKTLDYLRKQYN